MSQHGEEASEELAAEGELLVTSLSGETLYRGSTAANALLLDVMVAIADTGGPPPVCQQLIYELQALDSADQELAALCEGQQPQQQPEGDAILRLTLCRVERKNVALRSTGAVAAGFPAMSPLLRHDDAFPKMSAEEWLQSWEPMPGFITSGAELDHHLAAQNARDWFGDSQQSSFLAGDSVLTISFPEGGARLERVGFTYSPWDRCYGTVCDVLLSADGESDFKRAGSLETHRVTDRGDPMQHNVKTAWLDVPPAMGYRRSKALRLDFGVQGHGRRLYFVYAIGSSA